MKTKNTFSQIFKIALSLCLGSAILYWMYRDFDFQRIEYVVTQEMNWWWMLLSFPFGILAQAFRGWRWRQALEPLGEHPRSTVSVNSIFLSYAMSLIVPRIGEFARCGVLKRWDNVPFPKALGTVVTERAIDSLLVIIIIGVTLLTQFTVFDKFFQKTGTRMDEILAGFTSTGWLVTAVCGIAVLLLLYFIIRRLSIYNKVKDMFKGLIQGVMSVKHVRNLPLYIFFTIAIWGSYFLHYYLTFFCFEATSSLDFDCALVTFIVGSIAVIVPTPNGAGPWHFAVKTMLILYGVASNDALFFVLIVHSVQTLLVILLGIYAWLALNFTSRRGISSSPLPTGDGL
ncbi:hypothetical protein HMPREF1870_02183 [Bacteroidales bacterium KA00344]|nr:hypothetical protein HMPREF1870_02183 [Bacteroidales bacterium KA00344]